MGAVSELTGFAVGRDGSRSCPQVAHKQGDAGLGQREDTLGNELDQVAELGRIIVVRGSTIRNRCMANKFGHGGDLLVIPFGALRRAVDVARNAQAVARPQVAQGSPAFVGEERVVVRGTNGAP